MGNSSQAIAGQKCPAHSGVCEEPRSNYAAKNELTKPAASSHNTAGNSKISKELTGDDEKTLEYIKGIWTDVLSKVREKKMSTATYLAEGEPVSIKANQLTIGIPAQFILHKEVLEDTGNRQLIEAVLNDLSGGNIKINFVITNTQSRAEDKEVGVTSTSKLEEVLTAEPIVRKALELFEGKVTKVVQ